MADLSSLSATITQAEALLSAYAARVSADNAKIQDLTNQLAAANQALAAAQATAQPQAPIDALNQGLAASLQSNALH